MIDKKICFDCVEKEFPKQWEAKKEEMGDAFAVTSTPGKCDFCNKMTSIFTI